MSERNALVRCAVAALVLYVVAFAGLSVGGAKRSAVIVAIAVVFLVAAAVLLQLALSRARARRLLSPRVRLWAPVAIMAAGAALGVYSRLGSPTGGWGLCGLCAFYLGAGQALAELRSRRGGAPWRGVIVSAACAVLFAAGLILCLEVSAAWLALAVAVLLVAPVGLALLSEDVLRMRRRPRRLGVVLGPVLVLAGALALLSWTDIPASFTWALVGALFVLVGAIASSTQADVLLVVTVVALIWTATPRGVAAGDAIAPANGQPTLVSLGDSYMSGEGASVFFQGTNDSGRNECRRSPTAYAHLVVQPDRATPLRRLAFFACSGALAANVYARPQWPGEPIDDTPKAGLDQLQQLRSLVDRPGADVRLIIVSIGGNDAGFATVGMACLAPGSCVERGQTWLNGLGEVAGRVGRAYREIRAVAGMDVPVLAVPYPEPISDRACPYSSLAQDERRFLRGFVRELNGAIRQSARDAGFYYLGAMEGAFSDRLRICDAPEEQVGVNFIALRSVEGVVDQVVIPSNWIHNSLHPNERGHAAMAGVLESWLRSHPDPPAKPDPQDQPEPFTPVSLPDLMRPAETSYCGGPAPEPPYCNRGDTDWTMTQVGLVVRDAAIPALALVAGWWLLWLSVLGRTRAGWEGLGDRIGRRLLGEPPVPMRTGSREGEPAAG
jgi:lysophospholipase L1-like esterase